jgi:hypothetical protein
VVVVAAGAGPGFGELEDVVAWLSGRCVSPGPVGALDDLDKVDAAEAGHEVGVDVGVDGAERRRRTILDRGFCCRQVGSPA